LVDESDPQCLHGGHLAGSEGQQLGIGATDTFEQPHGHPPHRHQTPPAVGVRETRTITGDEQLAPECQFEAAGQAVATDLSDHRLRQMLERTDSLGLERRVRRVHGNRRRPQASAKEVELLQLDDQSLELLVDAEHPDLQGQVTAAENFTTSDDGDGNGHGTHVASIVAGTGDGSDGLRTGVAPGATLVDGKVLGDGGSGLLSWVIAGMEWAALEVGADIVNLSLGASPTDGSDPVSQSVNQLTETTGTLFVVAAGNFGPQSRTVGGATAPAPRPTAPPRKREAKHTK
jgi:hypothetical protein